MPCTARERSELQTQHSRTGIPQLAGIWGSRGGILKNRFLFAIDNRNLNLTLLLTFSANSGLRGFHQVLATPYNMTHEE